MKAGFKSFLVYRLLKADAVPFDLLPERMEALPAGDPATSQMQRSGFVPTISGNDELLTVLAKNKYALTLETALRIVPNKIVKRELDKRVKDWEDKYARVPTKDEKQGLKNDVIIELMENALIDYSRVNVLVSGSWVYVETTSAKKAELVLGAVRRVLGSLPVQPLTPAKPVVTQFTDWVAGKTVPSQLAVGEAFTAKGKLEGTRVLSGKSVDLDASTLSELLSEDYQVVALQLNYYDDHLHGTTSFTLNENLAFKSVAWPDALIDIAQDDAGADTEDEGGIALAKATMLLTVDALDSLVDGVVVSLGGEALRGMNDDEVQTMVDALKGWKISHVNGEELEEPVSLTGDDEDFQDPLLQQAIDFVIEKQKATISGVQREFRIGYNRSARLIEQLETQGIVGPMGADGSRRVWKQEPWKLGDTNINTDFRLAGDDDEDLI